MSIIWRVAVLSFDNPATQVLDELSCGTNLYTEPLTEAFSSARFVPLASGRIVEPARVKLHQLALSSGITRSPPQS